MHIVLLEFYNSDLLDVHLCHKLPIQSIKSLKACAAFHDTLSGCQLFMKGFYVLMRCTPACSNGPASDLL